MICIGCDPGITGAIALVSAATGVLAVEGTPIYRPPGRKTNSLDYDALSAILADWSQRYELSRDNCLAWMEDLQSFGPTDRVSPFSMQKMANVAGQTFGAIAQITTPTKVMPRVWKNSFGLTRDKALSVQCVRRLYGEQIPKRFRADKAEAVLIARYGLNRYRIEHP